MQMQYPKTIQQRLLFELLRLRSEQSGPLVVNGVWIQGIKPKHPLSGLRRFRALRKEGLIKAECINRQRSLYKILSTHEELVAAYRQLCSKGRKKNDNRTNRTVTQNNDSQSISSGSGAIW